MSTYRVGLVGTGGVAHAHMSGYRSVVGDRAVVTAACDPRADVLNDFCDRYGVAGRFPDTASMVRSGEVDVLVVLTPPDVRDEVIYPALEHGVHLLIEKPFAETGSRAVGYVRDARAASVQLAVSQNFRWFPEHQWLEQRLADPGMGTVRYLEHRSFQDRPQPPGVWRAAQTRLEMAIFSVHLIDRIQWLAGVPPVSVSALTRRDEAVDLPGEQLTSLLVQFENGIVGQMTSSWMSRGLPSQDLRVDAVGGSASVHRPGPMSGDAVGSAQVKGGRLTVEHFPDPQEDRHGPRTYGSSLLAFLQALHSGQEPPHSGRDNLRTMGVMDAAYLSAARGGEQVSVEEALGGYRFADEDAGVGQ